MSVVLPAYESNASVELSAENQTVARVLAGETNAFRMLVKQYQQPVFRFVRNLIGDEHDAEDVTQDVFLAAFNHLSSYDAKRAALQTWLFTIARNRCVNYLKRKRPVLDGEVIVETQPAKVIADANRKEFWIRLDEALNSLPIQQKTAFVLAEIEGLPYVDIAQIEQTTLGTVKSRIHRAKQRLRAVMTETMGEK